MREENIAGLDLNLLPALEALLRRRSVTQAAADIGLSQPAMSRALARLRDLHKDPLLVRAPGGYGLTPRAAAIQSRLAPAMRLLRDVYHPPGFDPATARRTIRLAAADVQTVLLLPPLMARLARDAPGLDLRVESYGPDLMARLESGALDFSFALSSTPLPPGIGSDPIGHDRLAVVMRRGHPAADRPWTVADYGRWDHAAVAIFGDGQTELDARLAAAGVTRRLALVTPHFMSALAAVAATDLVSTPSAALASRFADTFGLVLRDPPFTGTALDLSLVFSHWRGADPCLAWVRNVVREVSATGPQPDRPGVLPPARPPDEPQGRRRGSRRSTSRRS